jgi:hypothetical protein
LARGKKQYADGSLGGVSASDRRQGALLKATATMLVEMIPGGLGPYGVGDLVTALEALAGRSLDGLRLTGGERLIYVAASAIPFVPARPFVGAYRWLSRKRTRR